MANINIQGGSFGLINFGTIENVSEVNANIHGRRRAVDVEIKLVEECPHCKGLSNEKDAVCVTCGANVSRPK